MDAVYTEQVHRRIDEIRATRAEHYRERLDKLNYPYADGGYNHHDDEEFPGLPYCNNDEAMRIFNLGWHLSTWCPTIISLINKFTFFVVGGGRSRYMARSKEFVLSENEEIANDRQLVNDINAIIQMTIGKYNWSRMQRSWLSRYKYGPGDGLRRRRMVGGNLKLEYISASRLVQPQSDRYPNVDLDGIPTGGKTLSELAPYGILYSMREVRGADGVPRIVIDYSEPRYYFIKARTVESGEESIQAVPAEEIQHAKYGVQETDPRGVSPWYPVWCNAMGIEEVSKAAREMLLTQSETAVTEFYDEHVENDSLAELVGYKQQEKESHYRRTGERRQTGAYQVSKANQVVHHNVVQVDGFIKIIEQDQQFCGNMIDAPDWLVTGRSDIGNINTTANTSRPFWERIKGEQLWLAEEDAEILWDVVGSALNIDSAEQMQRIQDSLEIVAEGFEDPSMTPDQRFSAARDLRADEAITRKQFANVGGFVYDSEAICRENEGACSEAEFVQQATNGVEADEN